jgi:hypothetical protein
MNMLYTNNRQKNTTEFTALIMLCLITFAFSGSDNALAACANKPVKISGTSHYYDSISAAYVVASTGQIILLQEKSYPENLLLTDNIDVTLKGGYDCNYSSNPGFSSIAGKVTIGGSGSVTAGKLIIRERKGWELNETNTGLAGAGIDKYSLPLYQPPSNQIQYGTWYVPANTVVREKRIEVGGIVLSAGNITFERCWFHPLSVGRGMPLIHNEQADPALPNYIRDSDIDGTGIAWNADGTNPACGSIAISTVNIHVERCNIWGFGSGIALGGQHTASVEDTYIHDLVQGEWVLGSGQSHQDGLTIRNYTGTSSVIKNNYILTNPLSQMATGPIFFQATWNDCFIDNVLIEGNLLAGYGYSLALERDNGGYGTNMRAINNRFNPFNGWFAYVEHGPGWAEWQNNYHNDPSLTDNSGAVVSEPMTQSAAELNGPTDLEAIVVSGGAITLSWTDNSGNELGFKIMRSLDGITFDSLTITDANATSYTDTGLKPGTLYYYRIAAVNSDGISEYSVTVSQKTSAGSVAPLLLKSKQTP